MYQFNHKTEENLIHSPFASLFLFIAILFFGAFFGSMVSILVVTLPYSGFDMAGAEYTINHLSEQTALICHAVQGVWLFTTFIFVPLLYFQFIAHKTFADLSHPQVNQQKQLSLFLIGLVFILSVYPFGLALRDFTITLVDSGFLGEVGKSIVAKENSQTALIEAMLNVHTPLEYLSLFFIIAVLPAIGEELVFRGVIQNILLKAQINHHVAIVLTAVIFSAMHLNLTDFLPRVLLGGVLGYAYYYSRNFWVPVFLHFMNNALSVVYYLLLENKTITYDIEATGQMSLIIVSIGLLVTVSSWYIYKTMADKSFED